MKYTPFFLIPFLIFYLSGCKQSCCINKCNNSEKSCTVKSKNESMMIKNEKEPLACSLTNVELKERKKTIAKFKKLIHDKYETENGMIFKFKGGNENLEEIMNLVKLERKCCSFLTFDLKVQKEAYPLQLTISGPEGTRDFLMHELGL